MKLSYFELLSPEPFQLNDVCKIISPKLKEIAALGTGLYQYYLSLLAIDLKTFFEMIGQKDTFEALSDEEKMSLNLSELIFSCPQLLVQLESALTFFLTGKVSFSVQDKGFIVEENKHITGIITTKEYPTVCNLICQRNCIPAKQEEDLSKVKNKKALEIMKKLRKGKTDSHKKSKSDSNMELGNIISAIANKSNSLNILNIWDLTVYQLWDCFMRLSNNNIYELQAMSVATWGDKDKHFDASAWFNRIDII